jgi:hypothetical protein
LVLDTRLYCLYFSLLYILSKDIQAILHYFYNPRNKIAIPLRQIVAPAMAWVYLSSRPNVTILRP